MLVNLILLLLIALPIRYGIERIKFFKKDRNPQWTADLKNLGKRKVNRGVLFNYGRPIDAMFYTDLTVYSSTPNKSTIKDLQQKGYTSLIYDNGRVSGDILDINNIERLHMAEPPN